MLLTIIPASEQHLACVSCSNDNQRALESTATVGSAFYCSCLRIWSQFLLANLVTMLQQTNRTGGAGIISVALVAVLLAATAICLPPQSHSVADAEDWFLPHDASRNQIVNRHRVLSILKSNLSRQRKIAAIAPIVSIGDSAEQIEEALGSSEMSTMHGPGFQTKVYGGRVVIGFYPSGEVYGIGHNKPVRHLRSEVSFELSWVHTDNPITWPKTGTSAYQLFVE